MTAANSSPDLTLTPDTKSQRLLSLDVCRGFMMFFVSLLHPLVNRVFNQERSHIQELWDQTPLFLVIFVFPFIMIMIWGSLFTFLSGISISYSLTKSAQVNMDEIQTKFKKIIIRSVSILIVQYIFLFFFSYQLSGNTLEITNSLVTGGLESGTYDLPSMYHFVVAPTLEAIVFANLWIVLVYSILWRKKVYDKKKAYKWFLGLGLAVFVITFIIFEIIGDQQAIINNMVDDGDYLKQMVFIRLIGGRFSFFPMVGYGFIGAVIGIGIASHESYKSMAKFGFGLGFAFLSVFLITIFLGFDYVADLAGEHQPFNVYCFNLGGQMIIYTMVLKMDYTSPNRSRQHAKRTAVFRRYGKMTLTVYFLDGILSVFVYKIFYWLYGGMFYDSGWKIASYLGAMFVVWYIITRLWEKIKYRYSVKYWIHNLETAIVEGSKPRVKA